MALRSTLIVLVGYSAHRLFNRMLILLLGRTGRMGHRGIATSFYTERDEPIASVLVRTLLETKQEVPDFLQPFMPTGKGLENLKFETESDFDPEEAGIAHLGGGEWGGDSGEQAFGGDAEGDTGDAGGGDVAWGGGAATDAGNKEPEQTNAWNNGGDAGGGGSAW